ncbi:TetR family transcriptional regulator [Hasllibacter halocynthiae]|uniref:TetR family transcriptional regulator n=2 Tax=Hasllibacter halocynthiae TaxID=595589 RepID=A0A2T0X406_9RHOB|nr:TetR family transcriptional regulator [Hasllibacter halocynthiae]
MATLAAPAKTGETTRERIAREAALLFQRKGFHGTGMADVLAAAGVPKGSLYHHFPNGKADLALAAADWASGSLLGIVEDAFASATRWDDGVATLSHKLAKLFEESGRWAGCPITSTLFTNEEDERSRAATAAHLDRWTEAVARHAARMGCDDPAARAEGMWMAVQGAWTLSRVRRTGDPLRRVPRLLGLAPEPR